MPSRLVKVIAVCVGLAFVLVSFGYPTTYCSVVTQNGDVVRRSCETDATALVKTGSLLVAGLGLVLVGLWNDGKRTLARVRQN